MVKNGGIVLEELISSANSRCNPTRSFSAKQLLEATNNFQSPFFTIKDEKWFKACLNNHRVVIKKYIDGFYRDDDYLTGACRDIAITSQMSSHNQVLKLLGCCLEFPVPGFVYEDAENGPLNRCDGINGSSRPWKTRLELQKILPMHSPTSTLHFPGLLYIGMSNQKMSDFERPIKILVLFVANKTCNQIVDSKILEKEGVNTEKQRLQDFLNLALKCTQKKAEDRPMMIDVAKELVRLHSSTTAP
ncbi:hypothetical protein FEM48_Zijuj08G0175800 [Ziziphus jujuba var. spinosa]|uniref:Non-functional pseudokinase ZED1-like n=1 Tax=Ziziphus jujuba var. spinosa TaxID=714518 RepID=A0A978V0F9_ZIZJJ|nr:hypothetical protein FEM48_Zijuj08G0175800 [Ziziphus jujuba var. spinosa]